MVENPYFQFPLCALALGKTMPERLNVIMGYSVVHAGSQTLAKLSPSQWQQFLEQQQRAGGIPSGFCEKHGIHRGALYGAHCIGVRYSSIRHPVDGYWELHRYLGDFEARHGRDARVRIKQQWLFDTRDHHGISYREFAVLCAIYSAIGNKRLAIVSRARITRCALGYRTSAIMQAEFPHRTDGALPLTIRQLRDTITALHENKFFARATVGRRLTYYSIRLNGEQLRKAILERRTYGSFFHASEAAQDAALTAAIRQRHREAASTQAKSCLLPTVPDPDTGRPGPRVWRRRAV